MWPMTSFIGKESESLKSTALGNFINSKKKKEERLGILFVTESNEFCTMYVKGLRTMACFPSVDCFYTLAIFTYYK